jgi:DNA primase
MEAVARIKAAPTPEALDTRHQVYSHLLESCPLSREDREGLIARGLGEMDIAGRGYGTLAFLPAFQAVNRMAKALGDRVFGVPGVVRQGGRAYLTRSSGLLIPCRGHDGRIQGIQVRVGMAGVKYAWLSHPEASVGSPIHVPLGSDPGEVVRVTEGPLKADVAFSLGGVPTLGLAGASAGAGLPDLLRRWPGVKRVELALDMDEAGRRATRELKDALEWGGWDVAVLEWGRAYKGIDDCLLARRPIKVASPSDS